MFITAHAQAQKADSTRNALGVFAETNTAISDAKDVAIGMAGLQYNHRNKKGLGFRFIAAYGSYHKDPFTRFSAIIQDTAIARYQNIKINMAFIGGGLEAEKQFYHRLYFFAGFELRAGYGSGSIDTSVLKEYYEQQISPITGNSTAVVTTASYDKKGADATLFFLGLTPYFGLKVAFRRFCIGTEFKNYFNFTSLHHNSSTDGSVDFDSRSISQSFFIQYKF